LEKELRKRGIEPEPVIEMGSPGAIINMIIDGYGISYIPKFMAEKYIECGQLVEIDVEGIDINMHSYYLCSRHRWMNPIMKEFIRVVKEN
ncbi:MAG: substrate-binding domain-containing protein, partial [Firmicutes bacterium]|nr:substrate-binding domain-containing protein [Bacillota bacterium]